MPNPSQQLKAIVDQLSINEHQSVFADAIRMNPAGSVQMIYDQSQDNRPLVVEIVGEEVLLMIEKLYV